MAASSYHSGIEGRALSPRAYVGPPLAAAWLGVTISFGVLQLLTVLTAIYVSTKPRRQTDKPRCPHWLLPLLTSAAVCLLIAYIIASAIHLQGVHPYYLYPLISTPQSAAAASWFEGIAQFIIFAAIFQALEHRVTAPHQKLGTVGKYKRFVDFGLPALAALFGTVVAAMIADPGIVEEDGGQTTPRAHSLIYAATILTYVRLAFHTCATLNVVGTSVYVYKRIKFLDGEDPVSLSLLLGVSPAVSIQTGALLALAIGVAVNGWSKAPDSEYKLAISTTVVTGVTSLVAIWIMLVSTFPSKFHWWTPPDAAWRGTRPSSTQTSGKTTTRNSRPA